MIRLMQGQQLGPESADRCHRNQVERIRLELGGTLGRNIHCNVNQEIGFIVCRIRRDLEAEAFRLASAKACKRLTA